MLKFLKRFHIQLIIGLTTLICFVVLFMGIKAVADYHYNSGFKKHRISPYHICIQESIHLASPEEIMQFWLQQIPPRKTHHFRVQQPSDIPKILSLLGINNVEIKDHIPGFNSSGGKILYWYFKEPEPHLLKAYFKPRVHPFGSKYQCADYQYTLSDMLNIQNDQFIEEDFVFWDANKIDSNLNIDHHIADIPFDADPLTYIRNYLTPKISSSIPELRLNCYNSDSKNSVISPLCNNATYNNHRVDLVYFDGGLRFFDHTQSSVSNLLNLANGATKVYLFTLNKLPKPEPKPTPKLEIKIVNIPVVDHTEIGPILKDQYGIEGVNARYSTIDHRPCFNRFNDKTDIFPFCSLYK